MEYRLRQMMPDIAEMLANDRDVLRRDIAAAAESLRQIQNKLDDMCTGRVIPSVKLDLNVTVGNQQTQQFDVQTRPSGSTPPRTSQPEGESSRAHATVAAPEPSSSSNNPSPVAIATSTSTSTEEQLPATTTASASNGEPPQYRLSRTITTVPDVWKEWNSGIGAGPAVQHLEDQYGSSWRTRSGGEGTLFCRRKAIVDKVKGMMRDGLSETQAVSQLEDVRVENGFSLYALHAWLKGKR